MTGFILKGMMLFEFIGAILLAPVMIRDFGIVKGIWYALFHSISAFCNAGFDLMGREIPFSSLTAYAADPLVNFTIMSLIITGGIGFFTWQDIYKHKLNVKMYSMQTKAILKLTLFLILIPAVIFFFTEYKSLPLGERVFTSLFHPLHQFTGNFYQLCIQNISNSNLFHFLHLHSGPIQHHVVPQLLSFLILSLCFHPCHV